MTGMEGAAGANGTVSPASVPASSGAALAMQVAAGGQALPGKGAAIVAAAVALFAEQGFDATSVPQIAAAAKVGTGTIYRYFETKEALGNAAWQAAKRALAGALAPAFEAPPPTDAAPEVAAAAFRRCFLAFWRAAAGFARDWPAAFRFLEFHDEPRFLDRQSLRLSEQVMAPIHGWIAEGQARGVLAPAGAEVMAALVWGALGGLVRHAEAMRSGLGPELLATTGEALWRAVAVPRVA